MFSGSAFADRVDAGRRLADALAPIALERPVVYALPRGGVPVAAEVAARVDAPLDLVLVRKLGAPGQPELAVGAVVDDLASEDLINRDIAAATGADARYLASAKAAALREIARRREVYLQGRARIDPAGRDAIVVDDGVATGASMLAAVHALKHRGARRVIVATPVAPPETVARLEAQADMVVCLLRPDWFSGIGAFYRDFHQLEDDEVRAALDQAVARAQRRGAD